jgi:hypothetical protein
VLVRTATGETSQGSQVLEKHEPPSMYRREADAATAPKGAEVWQKESGLALPGKQKVTGQMTDVRFVEWLGTHWTRQQPPRKG